MDGWAFEWMIDRRIIGH